VTVTSFRSLSLAVVSVCALVIAGAYAMSLAHRHHGPAVNADLHPRSEIWVVAVHGGASQRIVAEPGQDTSPRFTQSGRVVYDRITNPLLGLVRDVVAGRGPVGVPHQGFRPTGPPRRTIRTAAGYLRDEIVVDGRTIVLPWPGNGLGDVALSPDGRTAALVERRELQLFDLRTRRSVPIAAGAVAPAFSPDGRLLAYTDGRGTLKATDLRTHRTWTVAARGWQASFSADGKRIVYLWLKSSPAS
jgi:hypothetical protein